MFDAIKERRLFNLTFIWSAQAMSRPLTRLGLPQNQIDDLKRAGINTIQEFLESSTIHLLSESQSLNYTGDYYSTRI